MTKDLVLYAFDDSYKSCSIPGALPLWRNEGVRVADEAAARDFLRRSGLSESICWVFTQDIDTGGPVWEQIIDGGVAIQSEALRKFVDDSLSLRGSFFARFAASRKAAKTLGSLSISFGTGTFRYECDFMPSVLKEARCTDPVVMVEGAHLESGCDLKSYVSRNGALAWNKFETDFPALMSAWREVKQTANGAFMPSHPLSALVNECYRHLIAANESINQAPSMAAAPDTAWGDKLEMELLSSISRPWSYRFTNGFGSKWTDRAKAGENLETLFVDWVNNFEVIKSDGHICGCLPLNVDDFVTTIKEMLPTAKIGMRFDASASLESWCEAGVDCSCKLVKRVFMKRMKLVLHHVTVPSTGPRWAVHVLKHIPELGALPVFYKTGVTSFDKEKLTKAMVLQDQPFWKLRANDEEILSLQLNDWLQRGLTMVGSDIWRLTNAQELVAVQNAKEIHFGRQSRFLVKFSDISTLDQLKFPHLGAYLYARSNSDSKHFHSTIGKRKIRPEFGQRRFENYFKNMCADWRESHPEGLPDELFDAVCAEMTAAHEKLLKITDLTVNADVLAPGHSAWPHAAENLLKELKAGLAEDECLGVVESGHEKGCTGQLSLVRYRLERLSKTWKDEENPVSDQSTTTYLRDHGAGCTCKVVGWLEERLKEEHPLRAQA